MIVQHKTCSAPPKLVHSESLEQHILVSYNFLKTANFYSDPVPTELALLIFLINERINRIPT